MQLWFKVHCLRSKVFFAGCSDFSEQPAPFKTKDFNIKTTGYINAFTSTFGFYLNIKVDEVLNVKEQIFDYTFDFLDQLKKKFLG